MNRMPSFPNKTQELFDEKSRLFMQIAKAIAFARGFQGLDLPKPEHLIAADEAVVRWQNMTESQADADIIEDRPFRDMIRRYCYLESQYNHINRRDEEEIGALI